MSITGLIPPNTITDTLDYIDNIAAGPVTYFSAYAFRNSLTVVTNGLDVWSGSAAFIPIPPAAGQQMSIVSTSANDTSGGTGINSVELHYLDHNGNEMTEDVTLTGTSPADTVATDMRFINDMHALTVGSNYAAVGTITLFPVGTPATVYTEIETGYKSHTNSARMVPAGKIFLIEQFNIASSAIAANKPSSVVLEITCLTTSISS